MAKPEIDTAAQSYCNNPGTPSDFNRISNLSTTYACKVTEHLLTKNGTVFKRPTAIHSAGQALRTKNVGPYNWTRVIVGTIYVARHSEAVMNGGPVI